MEKIKIYDLEEIINEKGIKMIDIFKTIIGMEFNNDEIKISDTYLKNILEKDDSQDLCIEKTNLGHAYIYEKLYRELRNNYNKWGKDDKTDKKSKIKALILKISDEKEEKINKNYKFCHIWGCSRNPWLNCAYWNTWFIPYMYSELSENNRGDYSKKFQSELKKILLKNADIRKKIIEYNNTIYKAIHTDEKLNILNKNKNYKYEGKSIRITHILKQLILIRLSDGEATQIFDKDKDGNIFYKDINISDYGIKDI